MKEYWKEQKRLWTDPNEWKKLYSWTHWKIELKKELIKQIYSYPKNKVILVADINFSENFLVYIDKIENVSLNKESKDIQKYTEISKKKIINGLFNTYDLYLKKKYEININYKALDKVSNYFE